MTDSPVDNPDEVLETCAALALESVPREFPFQMSHRFDGARPIERPADVHPVFNGCYDWHSAVHGHWLLARCRRWFGDRGPGPRCRALLEARLRADELEVEAEHLAAHPLFERPYGLAWVLALSQELRMLGDEDADRWQANLAPLVERSVDNLGGWLHKLGRPVRSGTHDQTAFALCLLHDWACSSGRAEVASLVSQRAVDYFGDDRDYPLHLEPGGEDFLSPSLGAASLMARLLEPAFFAGWLERVLPQLGRHVPLAPVEPPDRSDGRLTHLDGLNLSRAWMLRDLARALPPADPRSIGLQEASLRHRGPGLASLTLGGYEGGHWLGTFAAYLLGPSLVDPRGPLPSVGP